MAAAFRRSTQAILQRIFTASRAIQQQNAQLPKTIVTVVAGSACGAVVSWYFVRKYGKLQLSSAVYAKENAPDVREVKAQAVQTQRELRFLSFASVEYDGSVYMTPQDFLESLMEDAPRPRTGRTRLRREEVASFLKITPPRRSGTKNLFRNLHDKGLISYTEYLFLLCVLTKPKSGFGIAFNMFDIDGNQRVDKKEFLVLQRMVATSDMLKASGLQPTSSKITEGHQTLIELFKKRFDKETMKKTDRQFQGKTRNIWNIVSSDGEAGPMQDTTLTVHFFGPKGKDVLKYEDFSSFMENLQTEVLELEFNEFARGMPTITEEEFAKILLRYTTLNFDDQEEYIQRLRIRIPQSKGITFKEFKEFGQFLNNLDDFAIAMRMYTFADQPISEGEFKRAVKVCTGQKLNDHLVHTVFQLFDIDGDGHLSHKEFISVMKDRLHRGLKTSSMINIGHWETFKTCVKNEMRHL